MLRFCSVDIKDFIVIPFICRAVFTKKSVFLQKTSMLVLRENVLYNIFLLSFCSMVK